MLVKILTEYGPKPTLVVWDAGMSGRDDISTDYKAGRRERPDLLSEQWPHMHPLVDAFGYTNVKVPGYEADDVIATLTKQAKEKGIEVMVVTGDRDMFQLIEDGVKVMATSRGITETKIYDEQAVIDRYGIGPELIPDFYGLKGDTSDNIPGVPGIGDKTASDLLQKFGDLEAVLSSIDQISGAKRKENLTNHADDARISKTLATAVRDVEVDVDLDPAIAREPDRARLREVFREFELRDPLRRLEEAMGDAEEAAPRERASEVIEARAKSVPAAEIGRLTGTLLTLAAERPLLDGGNGAEPAAGASAAKPAEEELTEMLAEGEAAEEELERLDAELDAELTLAAEEPQAENSPPAPQGEPAQLSLGEEDGGLRSATLKFAAYGGDEVLTGEAETLAALTRSGGDRPLAPHDGKSTASAEARSVAPPLEHDTMVAAYLIDPARRGYPLQELATEAGLGARITNGDAAHPTEPGAGARSADGVAERAVLTRLLAERQRDRLAEDGLTDLFHEIELPLVDVLVEMERAGIKLDVERLHAISERFNARAVELERRVWELAGEEFTIGSPQQLAPILFEKLGLSRKRRGKTGFSTDARVLQAIRHE